MNRNMYLLSVKKALHIVGNFFFFYFQFHGNTLIKLLGCYIAGYKTRDPGPQLDDVCLTRINSNYNA